MAGIRLATNGTVEDLDSKLARYNLVANEDETSVRRLSDQETERRYSLEHSFGDYADGPRDWCVGLVVGTTGYGLSKVIETELISIETALKTVKEDIPDADILVFSHWI